MKNNSIFKRRIIVFMILICTIIFNNFASDLNPSDNEYIRNGEFNFEERHFREAINDFMTAIKIGEESNDARLTCLAYYNLGMVYFHLSRSREALSNFQKAYEIWHDNDLGPLREVEILVGLAGIYYEKKDYDTANSLLNKAMETAQSNQDSLILIHIWQNKALISNKMGEFLETDRNLTEAGKYLNVNHDLYSRNLEIEADKAILTGDYEKAYVNLKNILENFNNEISENVYISLMKVLEKQHKYKEALLLAPVALKNLSPEGKSDLLDILSNIYGEMGNYSHALQLKDSVILLRDSVARLNADFVSEGNDVVIDIMKYQMESDKKVLTARSQTRMWIIITLILIFLLAFAITTVSYIRMKSRNHQQFLSLKLEKEKNEKKLMEEKMEETERFASYREEMYQKDIEQKNREIEAHLMFINSRNDLLDNLVKHINKDPSLTQSSVVKDLTQYISRLRNNNEKEKENFLLNHEAADPEFSGKLLQRHPELLASDIKFLNYIRMNLNAKEISSILNITPDSCKRRKIRISKKLNLSSSSELYSYLLNL